MSMPSLDELNGENKIGCVRAIRTALINGGATDPVAADIFELFSQTKHATGDEKKDIQFLYQAISTLRRHERRDGGEDTVVEGNGNGFNNEPASGGTATMMASPSRGSKHRKKVTSAIVPSVIVKSDQSFSDRITIAHLDEVVAMVPEGMDLSQFAALLRELDRVSNLVGGLQTVRHCVARLMSFRKPVKVTKDT